MTWKYIITWIPGVPIAILNGMIRQFVVREFLDELPAHQLSAVTFIIVFGVYVWLVMPWLKLQSAAEASRVGWIWVGATVAFEFIFGHFVVGHSWETLLRDYDVLAGRLWVIVLAWIALSPVILYRLRKPTGESAA